ncbi:MAG: LysE family translocator [Spirochaetales bacterium]|jgi:cysteine/O-acetylserine efflux protein|nr:LysE family translocator [Spirochaetales bacterium]
MEILSAINIPALIAFTLVASFSPGPSTISTASMVLTFGYRKSIRYQAGILAGLFLVMVASGFVAATITTRFPRLVPVMTLGGALYILYLAFLIIRSSVTINEEIKKPLGFFQGMFLQFLNVKIVLVGLTVYSTFLVDLPHTLLWRIVSASFFAAIAIPALLLYSLFGVVLLRLLRSPRTAKIINALFGVALIYTAFALLWPLVSTFIKK